MSLGKPQVLVSPVVLYASLGGPGRPRTLSCPQTHTQHHRLDPQSHCMYLSPRTTAGLDRLLCIPQHPEGASKASQCHAVCWGVHVHTLHVAGAPWDYGPYVGPAAAPTASLGCV